LLNKLKPPFEYLINLNLKKIITISNEYKGVKEKGNG